MYLYVKILESLSSAMFLFLSLQLSNDFMKLVTYTLGSSKKLWTSQFFSLCQSFFCTETQKVVMCIIRWSVFNQNVNCR